MIADRPALDTGKDPRYPVRLDHIEAELDVGKHNVARAACDDVHGVAILLLSLDLAAGKFTPETIDFNDEAAPFCHSVVNSICFARPFLTNTLEHSSALVAQPGEVDGGCRFRTMQAAIHCRGDCELK